MVALDIRTPPTLRVDTSTIAKAKVTTCSLPTLWSSRRSRSEKKRSSTEPQGIETDTATYGGLEGPTELSGSMLLETAVEAELAAEAEHVLLELASLLDSEVRMT